MEQISKHCDWAGSQLRKQITDIFGLPAELRAQILQTTSLELPSAAQYLNALASYARQPSCVEHFFTLYRPLYADFAARWTSEHCATVRDAATTLSALAGILPLAPWLRASVHEVLERSPLSEVLKLPSRPTNDEHPEPDIPADVLELLLLAIFRLLSFDRDQFDTRFHPIFFTSLLSHQSVAVQTLAVECLCLVMHFADAYCENLLGIYVGRQKPLIGNWESVLIDYRLLKLWEERRWKRMAQTIRDYEQLQLPYISGKLSTSINEMSLHARSCLIGSVILPRTGPPLNVQSRLVQTQTAANNLQSLGEALLQQNSILLTGPAGSGKTSLIMEAARRLNKHESLITLHLNEQTDAKSLIGLYTSSPTDGSFVWQAGVLTRALQQGRWVLIEDIDRAPAEVLGVLRPVIENGSIFIPNRREVVKAADGFRILATVRTTGESPSSTSSRQAWLTSARLWSVVATQAYHTEEIADLVRARHPDIAAIGDTIFAAYDALGRLYRTDPDFKIAQGRPPSIRDLLKWCRRITRRVRDQSIVLDGNCPIPESFKIDIFKDAMSCHASHLSEVHLYNKVAAIFAQVMNIAPQQKDFYLTAKDLIRETPVSVEIGRSVLPKLPTHRSAQRRKPFANTAASRRGMESIAAGISFREPCLLVGETGVGKTSLVQHIAQIVGQTLTVVNLSQQSEVSDLLGGLKPVTTRSIVLPAVERFTSLFDDTFSASRNEKFQSAVNKAVVKENWPRLLKLWQEALQMAEKALKRILTPADDTEKGGPLAKRRKLETPKYDNLRVRWSAFETDVNKLRSHVDRGDKNQTFAFVEGRLVQAVRNGEWLLLDEINLASSDTLDHVVSLLGDADGEKPSILLVEAGNVGKVTAHPNFRVFAAMNPATDAGKKDLSAALRARFTEMYMQSGDDNVDDLVRIVQSYLGEILNSDKKAALDLARTYLEVQQLNLQHRLTDGAGDAPHFSIRSLVRCLLYVIEHSKSHGLRRSMFEGFAMSFFTSLSRDSEALCLPLIEKHLLSSVKNVQSFLAQQPNLARIDGAFVAFRHHLITKGPMNTDLQPHYIRTPSVERNLMNLARAASMRRFPILLQGPTSAGKTSMVEYLAKLSGNNFIRINNHEHTDLQEYLGSYGSDADGKLRFREGVLVNALREGHWIVLDELNLAPSDVLEALNRLLDDNRELLIPETQEIIRPHPNFMLFATQNPAGLYGGRKRFSRAFRNRFLEIHFDDIPEDELEIILRERAQIAPSFCTQIVTVYKKLSLLRQSSRLFEQRNSFATLRDLFRWASRAVDDRQQLARHGFILLAERVRESAEREMVKTTIEETMKLKLDEALLYGPAAIPSSVHQISRGIVWTAAMRRLYVLVSEALKNNEPVLLVGETGCGKTQICQVVAAAFGRPLNIYNAHTNTETGDLIGSQRPVRSRSQLALDVVQAIGPLVELTLNGATQHEPDVEDLIDRFSALDTRAVSPELVSKAQLAIGAYRSLFVWSDGSLVRSMKMGEHFLLDEISLADDSVLERLNSVLEPGRTIVLAEKGSVDNIVVAQPDFQFISTMNPGGDYGKRELSAALRNRMTEIWVPPLSNDGDVLPIVQTTLTDNCSYLAPLMLQFTAWFKSSFHNSANSTIPLRDLLTWAKFINTQSRLPPEVAFVHGAGLVFIDSIGANPAGMTALTINDIAGARFQCLEYLQTLVKINVVQLYNAKPELSASNDQVVVGVFSLPRIPGVSTTPTDLVFDAPTTLKNTMRIARALQLDRPVLLEGNPGVGKTAIVTALAQSVGKTFTRINLSDQTDLMDLFGADAPSKNASLGRFSWQDGPLLQAMQTGGWVLLDEMNLASQSVLEGLNSCLDHRKEAYIAELDRTFSCHPDFRLFAAQNPHHQGGGRKGLPASFVNRFTVVYADPFEKEDLMRICQARYPQVNEQHLATIVQVVSDTDRQLQHQSSFSQGGPWEANLRDVSRWLSLCSQQPALNPMYHFDTVIESRFRDAKQLQSLQKIRDMNMGDTPPVSSYSRMTDQGFHIGIASLRRGSVKQHVPARFAIKPSLLPMAKSISSAVQHSWPVIVSGPANCGKTEMIRSLAAISGHKLVDISMNADIDTMDLLGGFEQYDPARDLTVVRAELCDALFEVISHVLGSAQAVEQIAYLMAAWQACRSMTTNAFALLAAMKDVSAFPPLHASIAKLQVLCEASDNARSQFVWNDGVLIDAIQSGAWVVLDNANLCNSSVLDRLNSLLEADGHLVLSEQHSHEESGPRIIKPHPDFRIFLTMDPKYGELSRAMRNRSLEVFLSEPFPSSKEFELLQYNSTASISNLRELEPMYIGGQNSVTAAFIENLSIEDVALAQTDGQNGVSPCFQNLDRESKACLAYLGQSDFVKPFSSLADQSRRGNPLGSAKQPALHLLNQLDFVVGIQQHGVEAFRPAYTVWQLQKLITAVRMRLEVAFERSRSLPLHELSAFERSAVTATNKKANATKIPALYSFVNGVLEQLRVYVSGDESMSLRASRDASMLAYFLADLIDLASQHDLDSARFQAFLQLGQSLTAGLQPYKFLPEALQLGLQLFNTVRLNYGQGLQTMWQTWSPKVARDQEQLAVKLALEQLLVRFDLLLQALPQKRTDFAAIKTQLINAARTAWEMPDGVAIVEQLTSLVSNLEQQHSDATPSSMYFEDVFAGMFRKLQTHESESASASLMGLAPFVDSKLLLSASSSNPVTIANGLATLSSLRGNLDVHGQRLLADSSSRLSESQTLPLRALQTLREEVGQVARTMAQKPTILTQDSMEAIFVQTVNLLRFLLSSHENALPAAILDNGPIDLEKLSKIPLEDIGTAAEGYSWLMDAIKHRLQPTTRQLLHFKQGNPASQTGVLGKALVSVAFVALTAMVPDKSFDPALLPQIVSERHSSRRDELDLKICAQQEFNRRIAGQSSSLVSQLLIEDRNELGEAPLPVLVARPVRSGLGRVQEEFNVVIKSVLQSDTLIKILEADQADQNAMTMDSLQDTISRVIVRLNQLDRSYDDIVVPVAQLLSSLSLGIELVHHSNTVEGVSRKTSHHLPLLDSDPQAIDKWPLQGLKKTDRDRLNWLEHFALRTNLSGDNPHRSNSGALVAYLTVVDSFYVQWKERLKRDQANAETKSRYYAYRGDEDEDPEAENRELAQMFPVFDDNDQPEEDRSKRQPSDHRSIALQLSDIHQAIFGQSLGGITPRQLITSSFASLGAAVAAGSQSLEEGLPALFLQFEDQIEQLHHRNGALPFNIYTDHDISEIERLQKLLQDVKARFAQIHEQWPEHAVPVEVRGVCDELLEFALDTPLAKLLTKTEKLLDVVAQWQSVASKEWSAAALVEEITALIAGWRRLELTSWSRLLDIEKQKHDENAASWFFIAYEAVLYNSRAIVDSGGDISAYCFELVKTLEEFFRTATVGQFEPRLRLLRGLSTALAQMSIHDKNLQPISASVANIITHYERYLPALSKSLSAGRNDLEKAVIEQIKLASWKDTNVTALKDSARRSHHKLFKIVRKYRALLNQPISVLKSEELVEDGMQDHPALSGPSEIPMVDALAVCMPKFPDWHARPARLRDPVASIAGMRRVYNAGQTVDVSTELKSFRSDLLKSIQDLRKETPATLTEENTASVKHLRERKRRLLADTIKDVTHMGIRRNLATTDLVKQGTAVSVLAGMTRFQRGENTMSSFQHADQALHELIDYMPQVRDALTEHSPDLTDGEVRRGEGLLEGMLLHVLTQREKLVSSFNDFCDLTGTIDNVRHLRASESVTTIQGSHGDDEDELSMRLRWLPAVLDLATQVLRVQNQHGDMGLEKMIDSLKAASSICQDLKKDLDHAADLPRGLIGQERHDLVRKAWEYLADLKQGLSRWQESEPNVEYLVRKVLPWVEPSDESMRSSIKVNGINHLALGSVDQALKEIVDSIFVALQQLSAIKSPSIESTEDAGWLTAHDKHSIDRIRALHVSAINEKLVALLINLHHLRQDNLPVAISLLTLASPIIEQYHLIVQHTLSNQAAVHNQTVRLACFLAKSFTTIAKEGFCTPSDPSDGEEQSGKLESGTGLGDGEGAEDISKDVGADEDMTEFAQGEQEDQNGEMEDAEDAVDMGADDLEGKMDDAGESKEKDDGDESGSDAEGDEIDEETGSVDDLDPAAVDEKMWDEAQKEGEKDEKELKGEKQNGEKTQDQTEANGEKAEGENEGEVDDAEGVDEEIEQEDESGEGKAEAENADPHLQDENALELPEELQLNGEEDEKSDNGDVDEMDDLSDFDVPPDTGDNMDEVDNVGEPDREEQRDLEGNEGEPDDENEEVEGLGEDDEFAEDQEVDKDNDDHKETEGEMQLDDDQDGGGESGAADQVQENVDPDQNAEGQNEHEQQSDDKQQPQGASSADNKDQGESGKGTVERGQGRDSNLGRQQKEALRKLADVLEQWHQRREILNPAEDKQDAKADQDVDMDDADFEHLDDEDDADAQALGAAGPDQTQDIDMSKAIQDDDQPVDEDTVMPDPQERPTEEAQATERLNRLQANVNTSNERREDGAFVPERSRQQPQNDGQVVDTEDLISETASDVQHLDLDTKPPSPSTSHETAMQLWNHCSQLTHQFSLILTEQLRLILHPTTATKLRGDFRSGKRLNLKRIIPYIASGYKRDKIWMRRSVPSKRNYQIMLAVDDSKSMAESGADLLALQTTALLCKSLAMLEVGEVCVVGFGDGKKGQDGVKVAHEFGDVWKGADSGANVFGKLGFRQEGTDVKLLVRRGLEMMSDARAKKLGGGNDGELWQLMIIVSDGHCSDHDEVRRLVRKGKEERVMIVFVILDNINANANAEGSGDGPEVGQQRSGESILDLKEAVFEEGADGEMKVVTRRYLEKFPFEYYLVVRDVRELPGVLGRCLKGWFGEVSGT